LRFFENQKCDWCEETRTCVKIVGLDQELAKKNILEDKLIHICPQCIYDTYEEENDPEYRRARLHVVE
jgi:hypothetical protein